MKFFVFALRACMLATVFFLHSLPTSAQTSLPIKAQPGETIRLDATDAITIPLDSPVTPEWEWIERPATSVADFSSSTELRPAVTIDVAGTYRARVNFNGSDGSVLSTAEIEFGSENLAPVARLIARGVPDGSVPVTLDGSASFDLEGGKLTYIWSVESAPAGSNTIVASDGGPVGNVQLDLEGAYSVALTVHDPQGLHSEPALIEIEFLPNSGSLDFYRLSYDSSHIAGPTLAETFDIGERITQPGDHVRIDGFIIDDGAGAIADSLSVTLDGVVEVASTAAEILALIDALEMDPDTTTNVRISPNEAKTDLTFIFGGDRGSVTLTGVIGAELTRDALEVHGVDFYEGVGGRQIAPVAEARFDQLGATVGVPLRLEPYASTDIDGSVLVSSLGVSVVPAGGAAEVSTGIDGMSEITVDSVGDYLVSLQVDDGAHTDHDQVLVAVGQGANLRPVARIAPVTEAVTGSAIVVDGSQSYDLNGDIITHEWALISAPAGSVASLEDERSGFTSVVPDVPGYYVVQLIASDEDMAGVPSTTLINVAPPLPVAEAGLDRLSGDLGQLTLDGTFSVGDGALGYAWSALGLTGDGSSMSIDDGSLAMPSVSLDIREGRFRDVIRLSQVYHFKRSDTGGYCQFDTRQPADLPDTSAGEAISITLHSRGSQQTVQGPIQVWEIENKMSHTRIVQLEDSAGVEHGSFVLPGRVSVHVASSEISGSRMYALVDGVQQGDDQAKNNPFNRNNPVCTGPGAGVVQLIVSDGAGVSLADTVFIGNTNLRPVLGTGPKLERVSGETVDLLAANYGFDANGDTLSYGWSLIARPDASVATISSSDPALQIVSGDSLIFAPDKVGVYLIQITASDGELIAEPAVIEIEVINSPPVAIVSGDAQKFVGEIAALDGTASFDPDGDALSYQWALVSAPTGSTAVLSGADQPTAQFSPDRRGDYVFNLTVSDYEFDSPVVSFTLTAPNRPPFAALDGPIEVGVDEEVVYTVAASFDPDNDPLSFSYEVTVSPAGSSPYLADLGNGDVGFVADFPGDYVLEVTVSDGLLTATQELAVIARPKNAPPILGDLRGLYTIELGLELALGLEGSDPDSDPISFFATPLPLAAGVTLDALSGSIRFRPEVGQVGTYAFTVGVSDGTLTDEAVLNIEVVAATAGDTSVFGRVLDAHDFANGIVTPLAGMPVRLRDAALMTVTDSSGEFNFGSLTPGGDQVFVEPSANGGPGGFVGANRVITATENQNRDLAPDFLLVPLNDGCTTVVAGQETVLNGASSGVGVTIPADSILDQAGAAYAGDVCLGSLPDMFDHPGFSEDTQACRIFALDAPGAVFTQGMMVQAPNLDLLPEQTRLEMWRMSQLNGLFRRTAVAGVDAGGSTVSGTAPSFTEATLFTFLPQAPATEASSDQPTGMSSLSPFTGDNETTYALPGYTAFGKTQQVSFSYHSQAANPTIIVAGDVTIAADASLPVALQTRLDIGGLSISDSRNWTPREAIDGTVPAIVGEAVTLNQSTPVDGSGLTSGRYNYRFVAKANYACSTVSNAHQAEMYVQNETDSPYGNGWSVEDLQKLVVGPDGKVSIIDDGTVTTFDPKPTFTEFEDEPLIFPTIGTQNVKASDVDSDGDLDVTFGESGTGDIGFIVNFGNGDMRLDTPKHVADPNAVPQTGTYPPNLNSIAVGDLTGNDVDDVAYALQLQRGYGFIQNDGFGGFVTGYHAINTGRRPLDIAITDMDKDGYQDIVYGAASGFFIFINDEIWVDYGGPTGRTRNRISYKGFSGKTPLQILIGDIDGNGFDDVTYRTREGMDFVFNNGNRSYNLSTLRAGSGGIALLGDFASLADFNGDGQLDIVYSASDSLQILLNTTGRNFAAPVSLARPPSAASAASVQLGDTNGDGLQDIILTSNGQIFVYISNGDGTFQPFETGLVNYGFSNLDIADVNGDGSLDLISGQRFSVTVHFSKPSASGQFVSGNGEFSTLERLPDGTWVRLYKDGTSIEYDTNGLQTAVVDTQGNRMEYAYGPDGRLATITDQVGGITSFSYNPDGRLASVTYPDGRVTAFTYDDIGNLSEVTEPVGSTVSFAYDENGRLISSTNQNGNTSSYAYDAVGNLSGAVQPDGSSIANQVASSLGLIDGLGGPATDPLVYVAPENRVTTVTDRKGQLTEVIVNQFGSTVQVTDPLGRVTKIERDDQNLAVRVERPSDSAPGGVRVDTITYDDLANVASLTEAVGTSAERTVFYTYEPTFNKVLSMTDGDGFTTFYEYDAFGEATKIIDPESGERLFSYTAEGKLSTRTDENGNVSAFAYNAQQNLDAVTYADGSITQTTYDTSGNTTVIAEAAGTAIERQVQRSYDAMNRVLTVEVTGADGAQIDGITQYSYLPAGNLATVTDETGLTTSMSYDTLERLTAIDDPAEGLIQRTYNAAGEVTQHINGDGETHIYDYDDVSRLIQTTDPEGYVKAFAYDTRDNISTVTDGRGGLTTFAYDPLDRMLTRSNPLGETMTRAYDLRDNLTALTREDGTVENATYDSLSRRTGVTTPDNTLTYSFDPRSNLTAANDSDSGVSFAYDERNRLASTTTDGTVGPQPAVTLSYGYDVLDRRVSMSDSLGGSTAYTYDVEDRLTDLTSPWGTVYSFGYDGEGRRTSLSSTSGRNSTMGYTNGLLTALMHAQSGVSLTDLAYEYGPDGQLTAIEDNLDPSKSKVISYDALNRLVQVDEGIPPIDGGTPIPVEDYAYDGEGNRLASHLSNLYSSNDHNQLLEDEDYTYAYDSKGNRVSQVAKVGGEVETYTYDSQNRLVGYSSPTTTATYAYDVLGRRSAKVVDGVTTAFVYDTWATDTSTASDIVLSFNGSALAKRWLHSGKVDEPLSYEQYAGDNAPASGSVYEMYADRMGSISKVVDVATGAVVAEYRYDAFGQQVQFSGSLFQFYGYTGRETDPESGLIYYRARTFDPASGQFLQRDPIGFGAGGLSLYSYVSNNPYTFSDPSGLTGSLSLRTLSKANAALALGATAIVYDGLVNGPLSQIMDALLNPIVFSNSNGDDGTTSGPANGDGGECRPEPPNKSWWEKRKQELTEALLATMKVVGLINGFWDFTPDIENIVKEPSRYEKLIKKWQQEDRDRTDQGSDSPNNRPDDEC